MLICNNLVHPFQNDPGCSQSQRVMEELLAGAAKIDGRTLAGLLNYFTELSPHIKYYYANETNTGLKNDKGWQLFFSESLPFIVAAASKNDTDILKDKFGLYSQLFSKAPTAIGLQLLLHFFYYNTIYKINNLYVALKDSGLPVEAVLNQLIKNKLKGIASDFIRTSFTAYQLFGIRYIDFTFLFEKWGITRDSLLTGDEAIKAMPGKVQQLIALQNNVVANFSAAIETVAIIADAANASLQQSLVPLKESLQQKHAPHIALLLTFLEVFSKLQQDLNGYTKKHLDFFYQDVLRLKPTNAQPDKVHIVFELQKQLQQYLLKKGLLAKADKDKDNTEINFALDEEMVVNKAQVKDVRTLFVNNQLVSGQLYAEGVYMAPNATTADGVSLDFKEGPKNYATLGGKLSKYTPPGKLFAQPYPAARIGFVLASPVLLLNEGERTIDITLVCKLDDTCNITSSVVSAPGDICCKDENLSNDKKIPENGKAVDVANKAIKLITARNLFEGVKEIVGKAYVYISEPLLLQAKQQGLSDPQATAISEKFIQVEGNKKDACTKPLCCSHIIAYEEEVIVEWDDWKDFLTTNNFSVPQQDFLFGIFKPFTPLKVLLSGEKDWIDPMDDINKPPVDINNQPVAKDGLTISMSDIDGNGQFTISIAVKIIAGKPPITFYNKDVLKEDLGTSLPLVKIGLDDSRKLALTKEMYNDTSSAAADCCFKNTDNLCKKFVSLYQFFREVVVVSSNIKVKVCGLKNIIVQNDESLQDVNGPVYPFGTRPKKEANFYIGSKEIFYKKWDDIQVNHNWKGLPEIPAAKNGKIGRFETYYEAYQHLYIGTNDGRINNDTTSWLLSNQIKDDNFKAVFAVLSDGSWYNNQADDVCKNIKNPDKLNLLFQNKDGKDSFCDTANNSFNFVYKLSNKSFNGLPYNQVMEPAALTKFDANTRNGFLRITLKCQDFLHAQYSFVLARQMMAFGRLPDNLVTGAYYRVNPGEAVIAFHEINKSVGAVDTNIAEMRTAAVNTKGGTANTVTIVDSNTPITLAGQTKISIAAHDADDLAGLTVTAGDDVENAFNNLKSNAILDGDIKKKLEAVIPNEPWTPIISNMSLDYSATAKNTDITLIHLYPYKNTYKQEQLTMALFAPLCDEGTLYIGLEGLVPGSNVTMLFQLAEATSNSEADKQPVYWHYLFNNQWLSLRKGFEILDDGTDNLTTSGIIKFAFPQNSSIDNTVMPAGLYWIKASVPSISNAVCETIAIYTQAVKATFCIDAKNDTSRLDGPLKAGAVNKLQIADANIKQVTQPFPTFDGQEPELNKQYYVRVSELLRHKNRAIQKFDYERLVLQGFPQVYKSKCINHSFKLSADGYSNDFPLTPGYVLVAVIPDLTKLQAGQSFEPKLPTGIIEKIEAFLRSHTSPFAKVKVVNPRYEKINFCLSVILNKGFDKTYYKEKLAQDLREFLAPWAVGFFEKLRFGQCVNKSDVVQFIETRDYVDYITSMQLQDDFYGAEPTEALLEICPHTPRSILLAGQIQVCIEEDNKPHWRHAGDCAGATLVTDFCTPVKTITF